MWDEIVCVCGMGLCVNLYEIVCVCVGFEIVCEFG